MCVCQYVSPGSTIWTSFCLRPAGVPANRQTAHWTCQSSLAKSLHWQWVGIHTVTWTHMCICINRLHSYSGELCFRVAARDKGSLHSLGITHIVNAAHGPSKPSPGSYLYVNTGPRFYRDMTVDYYGVEADDAIDFMLSPFFYPTARYIRSALAMGGKSIQHNQLLCLE